MIISRVSNGQMLSDSWETFRHDKTHRSNLFRDLARIVLSLNRTPLSHIGSLTLNNQGITTLTNRPLTLHLQSLENEGVLTPIPRNTTYATIEPYLLDLLACHDNRIYHQPNSIHDQDDGQQQLAALTIMRATLPQFAQLEYRHGPFVFTLTDLHQSNIFVDSEWHITSLIDLEWACSLPIQLQSPPYWLSGRGIDQLEHGEHLETYSHLVSEYIDAFAAEERQLETSIQKRHSTNQSSIMKKCWETGSFWYFQALNTPKGLFRVFNEHIQRRFCAEHSEMRIFDQVVSPYWGIGTAEIIERKIREEERYKECLREVFAEESPEGGV
jgi:hypothetical protein